MQMTRWMALLLITIVACGPSARRGNGDDDFVDGQNLCAGGASSAENTPAACSDGIDNDCDGVTDCADPDCSGIGGCPVCGMVEHPLSQPLALPDGVSGGTCTANVGNATCAASASCPGAEPQCCEISTADFECRAPYSSKLHFIGFGPTQTFASVSNIQSVCVTMEHSWMRDIEIDLRAPTGELVRLQKFLGQTGGEIYLGKANDCDSDDMPVPGTGAMYCWTPTATKPAMLDYANAGGTMTQVMGCDGINHSEMPPDNYMAADPWSNLIGATLNGDWELVVTDLWPIDNGYIFEWSIAFDPSIVQDCSGPIIQ